MLGASARYPYVRVVARPVRWSGGRTSSSTRIHDTRALPLVAEVPYLAFIQSSAALSWIPRHTR
eukprot:11163835-Lingulodinium_polyedra.AAC.1